jgi:hypothetical protein
MTVTRRRKISNAKSKTFQDLFVKFTKNLTSLEIAPFIVDGKTEDSLPSVIGIQVNNDLSMYLVMGTRRIDFRLACFLHVRG